MDEDALLDAVQQIQQQVTALAGRVDQLDKPVQPVAGGEHPDLREFHAWVLWLIASYRLEDRIPEVWWDVPGVVHELEALHRAWLYAYAGDEDGNEYVPKVGFEPVTFHDALARTLPRIKEWNGRHTNRRFATGPTRASTGTAQELPSSDKR